MQLPRQLTVSAGIKKISMNHLSGLKHADLERSEQRQRDKKTDAETITELKNDSR